MKLEPETPDGLPEKKETSASSEAKLQSAVLSPTRQFREVRFGNGANNIKIRSAKTGKYVGIVVKSLNNYQKEILSKACDLIEGKLKGSPYEESIEILMKITAFMVTSSKHVGGYSGELNNQPIVIFNSNVITGSSDEFALTVLHELLHRVIISDDRDPSSLEEAEHDLLCYALLGVPIPMDHWMFTKHPQLLEKLQAVSKQKEEEKLKAPGKALD